MECPKCGEGAVLVRKGKDAGEETLHFAHMISFWLDVKHNPQPEYTGLCVVLVDPKPKRKR